MKAGGSDDPDGSRTAAVLDAYFHAEHMRAFRRLLCPRLAIVATVWLLVGIATEVLSRNALFAGLAVLGAVAVWAAIVEWRAEQRLTRLVTRQ